MKDPKAFPFRWLLGIFVCLLLMETAFAQVKFKKKQVVVSENSQRVRLYLVPTNRLVDGDEIKVYVKTKDGSAIGGIDYTEVENQLFILTPENPAEIVDIYIYDNLWLDNQRSFTALVYDPFTETVFDSCTVTIRDIIHTSTTAHPTQPPVSPSLTNTRVTITSTPTPTPTVMVITTTQMVTPTPFPVVVETAVTGGDREPGGSVFISTHVYVTETQKITVTSTQTAIPTATPTPLPINVPSLPDYSSKLKRHVDVAQGAPVLVGSSVSAMKPVMNYYDPREPGVSYSGNGVGWFFFWFFAICFLVAIFFIWLCVCFPVHRITKHQSSSGSDTIKKTTELNSPDPFSTDKTVTKDPLKPVNQFVPEERIDMKNVVVPSAASINSHFHDFSDFRLAGFGSEKKKKDNTKKSFKYNFD